MSDNGFIRLDRLKTALSQVKTKVDSDIATAISESTISLTSLINSGDASTLSEAKGYADGLKIIIDSNISSGDSSTLTSANSYTDSKISSVNLTINDLNESIPGQINLALENYTEYSDFSNHTSNTSNPHNVTAAQVGAAAISHTHSESDITDLGNYSVAGHTHTVNDITDSDTLATNLNLTAHTSNTNNPHAVTKTQVGLSNVDNTSDLDKPISTAVQTALNDLEDRIDAVDEIGSSITLASLGGASATDLSNHISNTNNPHSVTYSQTGAAAASHTHTESDITDLGDYAVSSHTHTLSNITDVTATATEVNNVINSKKNIQMQLNDARMYGFFPAWEYEHEYSVGDCIRIPCCKSTQYLECIVAGTSGTCPDYIMEETGEYYKLDEFISVYNGQCIVDGTCVWLAQDIRDGRPVGSIDLIVWRTRYGISSNIYYALVLSNINTFYSANSDIKNNLNKSTYLRYIRLVKYVISSAVMSVDMADLRLFDLTNTVDTGSAKYLRHIAGAAVILDWCYRPFDYLKSENLNNIDNKVFDEILSRDTNFPVLSDYNSTFGTSITKNQIITEACTLKNKFYNNQITDDKFYFKTASASNRYIRYGAYGQFLNAGLPNITGSFLTSPPGAATAYGLENHQGAFYADTSSTDRTTIASSGGVSRNRRTLFNASRSNSIYGNSTTVQPNTITAMYCIKW